MAQQRHCRVGSPHDSPFEGQGHAHDRPAAVHLTEPPLITDPHRVEKGGVGTFGGHGGHRLDLYPRGVHGHQEHGQALVLGHIRVGAGQQQDPVRLVGHGGPHLPAVDHPPVTVAHRSGGDGGHVGAVVRLAVAEAAVVPPSDQPFEHLGAVEVGAHRVDHPGDQHGHGQTVVGGTGLFQLVEQNVELDRVAVPVARHRPSQ